jgi:hypothetical protein
MKYIIGFAILGISAYAMWPSPEKALSYVAPKEDIEMTVKTAVSAIQRQGKLLVLNTNLTSTASSEADGWVFHPKLTTETSARVEYTMALNDFNPKWVHVTGHHMLVTIPTDYLKWEVIETGTSDTDNGSPSFMVTDAAKGLHETNTKLIHNDLQKQAKNMANIVRNSAATDLKKLFNIPLAAAKVNLEVEVKFE